MDDATIAEIERWLRECAREAAYKDAEHGAPDASAELADPTQDQDRPFWPYLESEDFWRE